MDDFALQQPRHRLQTDVGMRRHIHGLPGVERQWSEPIEETPGSDEASVLDWKGP
ncbi:MAG TPA: hypothetical protein VD833_17900 [Vicinamibacterales bacterium]|nr:hypothetical protein [Vicinamibacterales bacterium]